jgi:hypothetical protein
MLEQSEVPNRNRLDSQRLTAKMVQLTGVYLLQILICHRCRSFIGMYLFADTSLTGIYRAGNSSICEFNFLRFLGFVLKCTYVVTMVNSAMILRCSIMKSPMQKPLLQPSMLALQFIVPLWTNFSENAE